MDFLNKAFAQLSDLFRSMTPAARMTTVLLLVVIVVSVAFLFNHQFASSDCYLFGGEPVPPSQLDGMAGAFGQAGLSDYEIDGNRIRVPRGKQDKYMAALADKGQLPYSFLSAMKKSMEGGPFVSKQKSEQLMKIGLQEELAKIISKMNGIESASVLYDVQSDYGLNPKKIVTASVQVKPQGARSLTTAQVQNIRQVVAPAIGATPESVAVVDLGENGRAYPGGASGQSGDVSNDRYLNTKAKYEEDYTASISKALSFVTGALVTVNVELHPELEEVQSTNKVDPKAVPIEVKETNRTTNSSASQPGGRPGVAGQGGLLNTPAAINSTASGTRTDDDSSTHMEKNIVSGEQREVRRAGLTPKRVTVSVGVPSSYYEDVWQQRNPTPAGGTAKKPDAAALTQIETDEQAKIQKYVLPLLPAQEDPAKDPSPLVIVKTFQHIPGPELPKPTTADHALVWFSEHAGSVGMGFLGIFSLLMVRSIVRSVPAPVASAEPDLNAAAPSQNDVEDEEADEPAAAPRLRRRRGKGGPSLRDELVDIVREDPDAAANILRNWIGTAN